MPRTFATSKLSRSGQTVIPKRVRYILGLTEGCTIRYERDGAGMRISGLNHASANLLHAEAQQDKLGLQQQ
jgi:bifunctional DNA-binding transcriptional regulator/antitoxin component of YhaV-PrlF toxin-antitoxin module